MKANNPVNPSGTALRILAWFCPADLYEEIEGDLIQIFHEEVKLLGAKQAKRRMILSALRFFRPGILLRNKFSIQLNKIDMLLSHLKFSIRLFLKDKFFSGLNVLGLSLGIGVSIILFLVLQYDLSYDQHYPNHERIYRLGAHMQGEGIDTRIAKSNRLLGDVVRDELPEVEAATRLGVMNNRGSIPITTEVNGQEVTFNESLILRTDSDYFKVFKHEFVAGEINTIFKTPHEIILTESTAKRIFGNEDPIGKTCLVGFFDKKLWSVTGVIKDLPETTHLKFNILTSGMETVSSFQPGIDSVNSEAFWNIQWNTQAYLYLLMPPNYDPKNFFDKWPGVNSKYFKPYGEKMGATYTPILQSLDEIHFHSDLDSDEPIGNIIYLYAFMGIGAFIILLACINYMNLATAKSARRAPEIGMKKALGSGKKALIVAFLGESVLLSLLSLLIALLMVVLVLHESSFNELIGRNLSFDLFHSPELLLTSLIIALGIGVLSGLYPSIYLPGIPTISALKGTYRSKKSSHTFRKVLISTQFVISMLVIVCTLFMHDQIKYMRNKDMGFNKENIIVVMVTPQVQDHMPAMKTEFLKNPKIKSVSLSRSVLGLPSSFVSGKGALMAESETGMRQNTFNFLEVGEDYFETMNIRLLKGRDFKPDQKEDLDGAYICNESASRLMGWGDDPIGKRLKNAEGEDAGEVIGLVKDFNYSSLHNAIEPLLMFKMPFVRGYIHFKVASDHLPETIGYIKTTLETYPSKYPFDYFFFDQQFDEQYKADERQYELVSGLSIICIFISLLGLLGLAAFSATQRTKEIGIRRILGANLPRIIFLLSKDVLLLVVLSALIVVPLSYWVIMQWLENFAYRVPLNYVIYFLVTCIALGFVFLTILLQSYKTARANPVDSLKYE